MKTSFLIKKEFAFFSIFFSELFQLADFVRCRSQISKKHIQGQKEKKNLPRQLFTSALN